MRVGPALHLVELLDPDRHAAERLADVRRCRGAFGLLTGQVAERVQRAGVDGRIGRLELLERRPTAPAELVDQRAGIAQPRCFPHAGTVSPGHSPWLPRLR